MSFLLRTTYKFKKEDFDLFGDFFFSYFVFYFSFFLLFSKSSMIFHEVTTNLLSLRNAVSTFVYSSKIRRYLIFNVRHVTKNIFGYGVEIYLLGVYFRVKYIKERNLLIFLLGKAVTTVYKVPATIGIQMFKKKRTFLVVGQTVQEVMQFVTRLERFRLANRYHGKGFHITGKVRKLALNDSLKKYKI